MKNGNTPVESLQTAQYSRNETLFSRIYSNYHQILYVIAFNLLQDSNDARDVVQNVFTKLWVSGHYKYMKSANRYLKKACKNACLDFIEVKHARKTKKIYSEDALAAHEDENFSEMYDFRFDLRNQVVSAFPDLSYLQRKVLILLYFYNQSYQDAAKNIGVSINTVKTTRRYGLKALKNKFIR